MFRRFGISLIILFSFLLVQGHNFVPHHHLKEITKATSHHHSHHHDEDQHGDEEHDAPYGASHQAEFGKLLVKWNDLKELLIKPVAVITDACLPSFAKLPESRPLVRPPISFPLYEVLFSYSGPLRAPPVTVVFA
jgi:hypothetical protein